MKWINTVPVGSPVLMTAFHEYHALQYEFSRLRIRNSGGVGLVDRLWNGCLGSIGIPEAWVFSSCSLKDEKLQNLC